MNVIALTGATSMLGIALIKQCIRRSIKVIAFVRPCSSRTDRLPNSDLITIVHCELDDLANIKLTEKDIGNPEIFYHFGWDHTDKKGRYICKEQIENLNYTLSAVQLAKKLGCKKFVGAGSQAEYGNLSSPLTSTTPIDPEIAYGVAKYAAGKFAQIECVVQNLEYSWVRILSVYGIYDNEDTLVKTFIFNCKNNYPMALGPCTHIWDYLYEDDAGLAFLAIGERGQNGKVYCLGSGTGKPLKEYLEIVKNIVNPKYTLQYGEIPYNEKSLKYLCADISELTHDTGWRPEVSFEEGIKKIISCSAE
jgi:nucleoside-diphosphate-sugar epimerase